MTGRVYLERGQAVTVLAVWRGTRPTSPAWSAGWTIDMPRISERRCGPRNVLIERQDGSQVVRPFRGLRNPAGGAR